MFSLRKELDGCIRFDSIWQHIRISPEVKNYLGDIKIAA